MHFQCIKPSNTHYYHCPFHPHSPSLRGFGNAHPPIRAGIGTCNEKWKMASFFSAAVDPLNFCTNSWEIVQSLNAKKYHRKNLKACYYFFFFHIRLCSEKLTHIAVVDPLQTNFHKLHENCNEAHKHQCHNVGHWSHDDKYNCRWYIGLYNVHYMPSNYIWGLASLVNRHRHHPDIVHEDHSQGHKQLCF